MNMPRPRAIVAATASIGVAVVIAALVAFLGPLRERWKAYRLRLMEDEHLARLDAGSDDERRTAADRLAEMGSARAVPGLIRIQRDWARKQAPAGMMELHYTVTALSTIGEAAIPSLLEVLEDQDETVRFYARLTLERMGPRAIPALAAAAESPKEIVRTLAKDAVVGICLQHGASATAAVPMLARLVAGSDTEARKAAIAALGAMGPAARDAIPELTRALDTEEADVRDAAVEALKAIRAGEH
jgi:HEAT repeat protein